MIANTLNISMITITIILGTSFADPFDTVDAEIFEKLLKLMF